MHDVTYANEIIRAANERLRQAKKGSTIAAVSVSLSIMSHVSPETLTETFKALTKGTGLDKITLKITKVPISIKCRSCNHRFTTEKPVTECPQCGSPDLEIEHSKEFCVGSIEVT